MIYFFTTSAFNYYPSAKALLGSIRKFHPGSHVSFLLTDRGNGYPIARDGFDAVFTLNSIADQIRMPIEGWTFRHDIMELATAVKPFVLSMLLEREDCEAVIFLDPDTCLFNPLDTVMEALEHHSLVFTPHMCKPVAGELVEREFGPLMHGSFNLGFFAVRNSDVGREFALWWKTRLENYCLIDHARGLFTDQKWINLVPCMFDDWHILKDPGCNVATWNTGQRSVTCQSMPDSLFADGKPLRFYHFAGIYSGRHEKVTREFSLNSGTLLQLQNWYLEHIGEDMRNPLLSRPCGFDFYDDGTPITKEERQFYRENQSVMDAFPNPFAVPEGKVNFRHYYLKLQKRLRLLQR